VVLKEGAGLIMMSTRLLVLVTALLVGVAAYVTTTNTHDPRRRFERRSASDDERRQVSQLLNDLLVLDPTQRKERLEAMVATPLRPGAIEAIEGELAAMSEAVHVELSCVDGYGPSVFKATYEVTATNRQHRRTVFLLEQRDGVIALIDTCR
jgi:hypothetical protein